MKYTFSIGLFDKDTKQQQISTVEAYKVIMNMVMHHFDGGSIYEARGFYKHDDGTMVVEPSLLVNVMTTVDVGLFIGEVKRVLNQESVYVEKQNVETSFM